MFRSCSQVLFSFFSRTGGVSAPARPGAPAFVANRALKELRDTLSMHGLSPSLVWRFAVAGFAAFALWWIGSDLLSLAHNGLVWRYSDGQGLVFGRDFFNFWFYGREAWGPDPGRYYDYQQYWAFVASYAGKPEWTPLWSYPPTMMLIAAPFGLLPYGLAYAAWLALGIVMFFLSVRPYLSEKTIFIFLMACPAAVLQFYSGQNAFFFAALLIAGLRFSSSRPLLSGLCLGLLTAKPQLGLMLPFILLIANDRRAFWAAAIAALLFHLASLAAFGIEAWTRFLDLGIHAQISVLNNNDPVAHAFMPSIYISLQLLGLPKAVCYILQAALALAVLAGAVLVWNRTRDREIFAAYGAAATLAATPYLMGYDALAFALPILVALKRWRLGYLDVGILAAFAATPLITLALGLHGWPGGVLPMLLGFGWFVWRTLGKEPALQASFA
jgi:hypothetical protein